ncbi:MAG TPA: hypothetical protein VHZ52_10610 [Acidobacteriaceae bacterium]|jgi:hypothetical protein|nr:hypothetical protein [Acidobacteriaceae bacterium]
MSEVTPTPPAPASESVLTAPEPNPAVAYCRQAYRQAFKASREHGKKNYEWESDAREAYRRAMPPLSGRENIRDFIACLAYAMLTRWITSPESTQLLYAAQVANATLDKPAAGKPGRPKSQPPPEN